MSKGIAILGAGTFARNGMLLLLIIEQSELTPSLVAEHLPAIKACPAFSLKAVYSRSKKSADRLAKLAGDDVDIYFDTPLAPGSSLDDLLYRNDIHAVMIALPTLVQPAVIKKAITAGTHVLSEKPISQDVSSAIDLLSWYTTTKKRKIWSVGENFRFMDSLNFGAARIKELDGEVVTFSARLYAFMDDQDEYYQSEWRKNANHSGRILLDSGVHYVAAIRFLLAAAGQSITHLSAFAAQLQQHLAPLDTIHSTMQISNRNSGTFSLSFGVEFKTDFEFQVVTDKGAVTVGPNFVIVSRNDKDGKKHEKRHAFKPFYSHAVRLEVAAFAKAMSTGRSDPRAAPEEALKDLKVMQAMLDSANGGGAVESVRYT
ncbi:hypothetical protein ACLMJK_001152 [Lecanora helva]